MRLSSHDQLEAKVDKARGTALPFATSQYPGAGLWPYGSQAMIGQKPSWITRAARPYPLPRASIQGLAYGYAELRALFAISRTGSASWRGVVRHYYQLPVFG